MSISKINDFIHNATEADFKKDGFSLKPSGQGGVAVRETADVSNFFGYGILDFGTVKKMIGFTAYFGYPKVEKIDKPILVRHNLLGKSALNGESFFPEFNSQHNLKGEVEIRSIDDLATIIKKMQLCFTEDAIPLFQRFNDLIMVNNYISNENDDVLFSVLGNMMPFRKATILRLCNSSAYQSYMDSFYNQQLDLYNKNPRDVANKRYYSAAKELKEILDETEPIY